MNLGVSTRFLQDENGELLGRISEISELHRQLEHMIQALCDQHGDRNETVASARALRTGLQDLKRELIRHYLDCRISQAERAAEAVNN